MTRIYHYFTTLFDFVVVDNDKLQTRGKI